MTPRQIECVQDSFAMVVPHRDEAAARFYALLFELAQDTRPMFKGDLKDQGSKLMQVLAVIVRHLSDLTTLMPSIDDLARRHVGYGVEARHYEIVGQALIETLGDCLGEAFTEEMGAAWAEAYAILSVRMIEASGAAPGLAA